MSTRADNFDGSCREVLTGKHAGKWRVQFTHYDEFGRKLRVDRIFATKTEGKDFLRDLRKGKRLEETRQAREATLQEWFEWLAEHDWPETLASITIAQRRSRFKKYVTKHFGHVPLSKIDPLKVRAFYRQLRDQGASESQVLLVKSDLVRAFNQAVTPYQQIPMTLANPFRLPVARPKPRQAVALNADEVKAALAQPTITESERAMLGLFLLAGLRLGELMAITRGQLRLDDHLIVIDRAIRVEYGGAQSIGLPKTGKTRNAVMCRYLKEILAGFVSNLEEDDHLWRTEENRPRMKKRIYAVWEKIVKNAKLPVDMSPHDCRLTHINLIEKLMPKVSVTTLKEHVGHSCSGVTEANYTRPISSAQGILRDELDRVFGPPRRSRKSKPAPN